MALGFIAWEGRSPLTGDQVALVVTGPSANDKTGPMMQCWVLVRDEDPFAAVRSGRDAAICGGCVRRGSGGGQGRSCYVSLFTGPSRIHRALQAGRYERLSLPQAARRLEGHSVRVTAYGDPVVLPFVFWQVLLGRAAGWAGYTHLWRLADPRFRALLMASVDSELEAAQAGLAGWRTFRVRQPGAAVLEGEVVCPASAEGGHRSTCLRCQLCRGTNRPAKSIVIQEHGRNRQAFGRHGSPVYLALRAALGRGERVSVDGSPRDRVRMTLALRTYYVRRGEDERRLRVEKLGPRRFQFWLGDRDG